MRECQARGSRLLPLEESSRILWAPPVIESPAKCEIRSVMRFLTARSIPTANIQHQITEVYGTEAMRDRKLRKWARKFKDGLFTPEHKEKRFSISLDFLIPYEEEGDDMLSRIVTGEEKWDPILPRNQINNRWNGDTHPLSSRTICYELPLLAHLKAQKYILTSYRSYKLCPGMLYASFDHSSHVATPHLGLFTPLLANTTTTNGISTPTPSTISNQEVWSTVGGMPVEEEPSDYEVWSAIVSSMARWEEMKKRKAHKHHVRKRSEEVVCYRGFGCFRDEAQIKLERRAVGSLVVRAPDSVAEGPGAFDYLDTLPASPEAIGTKFILYTNKSRMNGELLWYDNSSSLYYSHFNGSNPVKVIIHGFGSSGRKMWVLQMTEALLAMVSEYSPVPMFQCVKIVSDAIHRTNC
ncbi:inactive pancreatic lipase-related protein 1 [Trichonephila clavipes]|nr:inactive pancreatic lipase-related protein 1 [Trichonephila clavipes]